MQVGCGVGNAALPLLEQNPTAVVHACDFSATAVQLLRQAPEYASGRITAFVADLTTDDLREHLPAEGVDLCTMLFVLSAIDPAHMPKASPALCLNSAQFHTCKLAATAVVGLWPCSGMLHFGTCMQPAGMTTSWQPCT